MSDDTQLTIDGSTLDDTLTVMTSGRVIRPFNRMIDKGAYKCRACDTHFDEPAPSVEAARDTEQVTLPGVRDA